MVMTNARIEGDSDVMSSPLLPNPKQILFERHSSPAATLFHEAGATALSRTETWLGKTERQAVLSTGLHRQHSRKCQNSDSEWRRT